MLRKNSRYEIDKRSYRFFKTQTRHESGGFFIVEFLAFDEG